MRKMILIAGFLIAGITVSAQRKHSSSNTIFQIQPDLKQIPLWESTMPDGPGPQGAEKDTIDALSAQPNFAGLIYPVLTMLPPFNKTHAKKVFWEKTQQQHKKKLIQWNCKSAILCLQSFWRKPLMILYLQSRILT